MKKHTHLSLPLKKISVSLTCLAFVASLVATTSSFTDPGETGNGNCWKAERVVCNGTTTTTTYSGAAAPWAGPGDYNGKTTTDASGNITVITLAATPVWDPATFSFRYKIESRAVTVVTSSRSDCSQGGNSTSDCQPTDCNGQSIGTLKVCVK
ncbi:hypothetical protein [Paraflavitalea pollutisoli]|uniref:hypothetical protein n=1 Tax=Paraflavitalea pollutisoli TaxID=3034143 RepID=UPI0023EB64A0|nr:hypothetical protein [Paraflavitalea sp. H1-2-19X]